MQSHVPIFNYYLVKNQSYFIIGKLQLININEIYFASPGFKVQQCFKG